MRRLRRLLLWGFAALAAVAAVNAAAFCFHMVVPWTVVLDGTPGSCRVNQRMSRRNVRIACGSPKATGWPRFSRSGDFFDVHPTKCAAPCEAIGDSVVFYDCNDRVAEVRKPGEGWCEVDGHNLVETDGAQQGAAPDNHR
jgi:hypothetical protein